MQPAVDGVVHPAPSAAGRRSWRRLRRLAMIAALVLYPAGLLWPYDWQPPRRVANGAQLMPGGGIEFVQPGIARTQTAPPWLEAAIRSSRLALSLSVRSASPNQSGPARILTISPNPHQRNLMLGQEGSDLVLRLRTPRTDANGTIYGRPVAQVPGVFRDPGWVRVAVLIEPGNLQIAVGDEVRVRETLPEAPLQNWDSSFPLALGNELSHDRPWLGSIRRAIIRTGGATVDYATPGALRRPAAYWYVASHPELSSQGDTVVNLLLFTPLGVLLGLSRHNRRLRGLLYAVAVIAALSGTLETLQLFVAGRSPSLDDFVLNTLGGAMAAVLAQRVAHLSARAGGLRLSPRRR